MNAKRCFENESVPPPAPHSLMTYTDQSILLRTLDSASHSIVSSWRVRGKWSLAVEGCQYDNSIQRQVLRCGRGTILFLTWHGWMTGVGGWIWRIRQVTRSSPPISRRKSKHSSFNWHLIFEVNALRGLGVCGFFDDQSIIRESQKHICKSLSNFHGIHLVLAAIQQSARVYRCGTLPCSSPVEQKYTPIGRDGSDSGSLGILSSSTNVDSGCCGLELPYHSRQPNQPKWFLCHSDMHIPQTRKTDQLIPKALTLLCLRFWKLPHGKCLPPYDSRSSSIGDNKKYSPIELRQG